MELLPSSWSCQWLPTPNYSKNRWSCLERSSFLLNFTSRPCDHRHRSSSKLQLYWAGISFRRPCRLSSSSVFFFTRLQRWDEGSTRLRTDRLGSPKRREDWWFDWMRVALHTEWNFLFINRYILEVVKQNLSGWWLILFNKAKDADPTISQRLDPLDIFNKVQHPRKPILLPKSIQLLLDTRILHKLAQLLLLFLQQFVIPIIVALIYLFNLLTHLQMLAWLEDPLKISLFGLLLIVSHYFSELILYLKSLSLVIFLGANISRLFGNWLHELKGILGHLREDEMRWL